MQKSDFLSVSEDCGFKTGYDIVVVYCKDGKYSVTDLDSIEVSLSHKNSLGSRRLDED